MNIPRIATGLELVDDSGDEVVVSKISEANGVATLRTLDGDDSYTMSVRELRSKLRDGEFAILEPDDNDEEEGKGTSVDDD